MSQAWRHARLLVSSQLVNPLTCTCSVVLSTHYTTCSTSRLVPVGARGGDFPHTPPCYSPAAPPFVVRYVHYNTEFI